MSALLGRLQYSSRQGAASEVSKVRNGRPAALQPGDVSARAQQRGMIGITYQHSDTYCWGKQVASKEFTQEEEAEEEGKKSIASLER